MKNNKKAKILSIIALIVLSLTVVGVTFAFFQTQGNSGASQDITVTAGTTDQLSFTINKDIDMSVNQSNFEEGLGNVSDAATLTARLRPNSGTGEASDNYNVFFIIDRNELIYTTEDGTAELLLTITDPNNHTVEQIVGLKKVGNDFDITTKTGAILIAANYPISASNNIEEVQTWTVRATMVNLNTDQIANGGKIITGKLFLTKENLTDYQLLTVSGISTIDNGVSTVTNDSITLQVLTNSGTSNIASYHYAIEDAALAYMPSVGSILRLSTNYSNAIAYNPSLTWYDSNSSTYTFSNLTANTNYRVYAYVMDERGFTSNIYSTVIKTTNVVLPQITGVTVESSKDSLTITPTVIPGDNPISKYYYSIDGGETWFEGTESYIFEDLLNSAEYDVRVKVVDSEGNESTEIYRRGKTEVYQEPVINYTAVATTANSINLAVEATRGTNSVDHYLFSIDNGSTWESGTVNKTYSSLTEETDYKILIKAVDTQNVESAIYEVNAKTGVYVLPTINSVGVRQLPTSLTISISATAGTNSVSKYYYSIQNGVDYVESTTNPYQFSNLTSNATYYIKVYVEDTDGRISQVYSTSAKTEYVNPVINGITKVENANSIVLTVDAEGKSNEIDYYLYRLSDNDEWSSSATSEITIGSLSSDTEYSIQVKAIDTDSHESNVIRVSAKTLYVNPVVDSITVVNQTWNSITVQATATAGSHPISKYYFKTDQSSYVESNSNEYTFTGLNDGGNAAINYEITAYVVDTEYNSIVSETKGKSELTKVNTATLAYTVPTISVTNSTTSSSITLNATATQGSGAISKYSYSNDNGTTWVEHNSSSLSDSYTFNGLNDNTSYNIKVKVTDVNNREATYTGTVSTDYIEPVINGVTNTKTWNSVTLTVNATAGSTAIDKYYFRTSTGSYDSGQASNVKTFSGLTEDTEYTFYVKLVDVGGHEVTEQSVTVRTNDYNEPTLALNGAIQTTYNTVTVNVTGTANETGATIVSYSFKIDSETPVVVNSSSTSASYTFNVAEDQTHSIEVNMTDSFGRVATVTSTGIATPAYVYPNITSVTKTSSTVNSLTVTVVASDGTNAIRGYKFSTDNGSTYGALVTTTSHNYQYTITGLSDNTSYPVKVVAVDDIDRESIAVGSSMLTDYIEPTVSLAVTSKTWGTATLTATATAGSTAISQYRFKKGSEGWSAWQSSNTYTFSSLEPSTQYTFTVEVKDVGEHTAQNNATETTNSYTYVNISSVQTSNITYDSARITVTATQGTGAISTYEYKLSSDSTWTSNGSSNIINLSGINHSTNFTYNIRVKDSNNKYSNTANATFTTPTPDVGTFAIYSGTDQTLRLSNTTKSVSCSGSSVGWDYKNRGFDLSITNQDEIHCDVTFTDKASKMYLANYIKGDYATQPSAGTGNVLVNENGYRYEGANPNNYIWFNNELWRIVGSFQTEYDANNDGVAESTDYMVKIVRSEILGTYSWDVYNTNNWPTSTLYNLLNGAYYDWNTYKNTVSNYCYLYYTGLESTCDFSVSGLKGDYQAMVANAKWATAGGGKSGYGGGTPGEFYNYEHDANGIYESNASYVVDHVGLLTMSDYGYSAPNSTCARGSYNFIAAEDSNGYINSGCAGNSWIFGNAYEWLLTQATHYSYIVWSVTNVGRGYPLTTGIGAAVRPVVYLKPSVYLISGDGTISNPYTVGM